jgi:perosamine synthetase
VTNRMLMEALDREAIDTRPFFHPLSALPAYSQTVEAERARTRNAIAYDVSPLGLNLPSALTLTEAQVDRVCDSLMRALRGPR